MKRKYLCPKQDCFHIVRYCPRTSNYLSKSLIKRGLISILKSAKRRDRIMTQSED